MLKKGEHYDETLLVTKEDVRRFADLTGDQNPLHVDADFAKKTPFGKNISHGLLVGGYISAILGMKFPGPGTIYMEQDLKFLKPVFVDTTIDLQVQVEEIIHPEKGIYRLSTKAVNEAGAVCVDGYAIVKYAPKA